MNKERAVFLGMVSRPSKDDMKSMSVLVSPVMYQRVKDDARSYGISTSDYIRAGLNMMLDTLPGEDAAPVELSKEGSEEELEESIQESPAPVPSFSSNPASF